MTDGIIKEKLYPAWSHFREFIENKYGSPPDPKCVAEVVEMLYSSLGVERREAAWVAMYQNLTPVVHEELCTNFPIETIEQLEKLQEEQLEKLQDLLPPVGKLERLVLVKDDGN